MKHPGNAGFTLIELLVALVILALISVAGYRGLNEVLLARDRLAQETRKWQHLAFFFARMELDIAQAIHRPVRDTQGSIAPEWLGHIVVQGDNDAELIFTRAGMPDQGSSRMAPQRIGYRFEHGAIVMLRWPQADAAPATQPTRYPVLEGVKEFRLRYMDSDRIWQTQWPSPSPLPATLPAAVEVSLTLDSGENILRTFALQ